MLSLSHSLATSYVLLYLQSDGKARVSNVKPTAYAPFTDYPTLESALDFLGGLNYQLSATVPGKDGAATLIFMGR